MIREHEVPAWHRFCIKVAFVFGYSCRYQLPILLWVPTSKNGIRSLVIVLAISVVFWVGLAVEIMYIKGCSMANLLHGNPAFKAAQKQTWLLLNLIGNSEMGQKLFPQ